MSLTTMFMYFGIFAVVFTFLVDKVWKKRKSWLMTFLQSFIGIFFIFSGFVKVVDPLGTSYKLDDYFGEFEVHFPFLSSILPFMEHYAVGLSMTMIVFEIVLGLTILIGYKPKLSAWLFLLLVLFFTLLTGFTYLTGHVPNDATFLEFSKWGPWTETNMKVTDCGCFGDFIKLKPFTTFMKDVFLIIPGLYFLFRSKKMHQLMPGRIRGAVTWLSAIGLVIYGLSNFVWNIPQFDFRPFKPGVNIPERKIAEAKAEEEAPLSYLVKDKSTGKVSELSMEEYMKRYKEFPKESFEINQKHGEPAIPTTKISYFEISDIDGNDVTDEILENPNYSFMVIGYKINAQTQPKQIMVADTSFVADTIVVGDSVQILQRIGDISKHEKTVDDYIFDEDYILHYKNVINKLYENAKAKNIETFLITAYSEPEKISDFKATAGVEYPVYVADDILLKTIIRSNPGIVLLKNGVIINKWHFKQFPGFEKLGL